MADLSVIQTSQPQLLLSLKEGVSISARNRTTSTTHPDEPAARNSSRSILHTLVQLLSTHSSSEEQLARRCAQRVSTSMGEIFYGIEQLKATGLLQRQLVDEKGPLATLIPTAADLKSPHREAAELDTTYQLSSFCFLRSNKGEWLLESPLAHAKLVLHSKRALTLLHHLIAPCTLREAAEKSATSLNAAQILGTLLIQCRALRRMTDTKRLPASDSSKLSQWSFHDLLFHARTRAGRHDNPTGKTYPHMGQHAPLPAIKRPMSSSYIQLRRIDLDAIEGTDLALTTVLESRRSLSSDSSSAINIEQIGELLFRTARIRTHHPRSACSSRPYAYTSRPYPSGGAVYELELYLAVNLCKGLDDGLYHYHPQLHRLYLISEKTPELEQLLRDAYLSIAKRAIPQVLFIVTARHQRLSWAYESIAYSTTLKNVGVLFQSLYLVATAMNLSARAIGMGNADLFAKASGLDYYRESSVGEFVINNGSTT